MKKVSTVVAKQSRNISRQRLTIGLDLGDRNSWYCVLDDLLAAKHKLPPSMQGWHGKNVIPIYIFGFVLFLLFTCLEYNAAKNLGR